MTANIEANTETTVPTNPDVDTHYDFTLTVPLWREFVDAANAHGRSVRFFCLSFGIVFGLMLVEDTTDGSFLDWDSDPRLSFCQIGILAMVVFAFAMAFSARFRLLVSTNWKEHWGHELPEWFNHDATTTPERLLIAGGHDPGWRTPCRLIISPKGLTLLRQVQGRVRKTRLDWKETECVRETEHLIVIGPSAWSTITELLPIAGITFAEEYSVLVDKNTLPDPHAFAEACRQQAKTAHARRHGRLQRWIHGDDL